MKKILLILISITYSLFSNETLGYTYTSSISCQENELFAYKLYLVKKNFSTPSKCISEMLAESRPVMNNRCETLNKEYWRVNTINYGCVTKTDSMNENYEDEFGTCTTSSSGETTCDYPYPINPQGNGERVCDEIYEKDGDVYYCTPDNEASIIPNADGLDTDSNGNTIPKCIENHYLDYSDYTCNPTNDTGNPEEEDGDYENPDGTCKEGSYRDMITNKCKSLGNNATPPSAQDNGDGTTTITFPDGSSQTYDTSNPDNIPTSPISSTPPTNSGGGVSGSDGYGGNNSPDSEYNPDTSNNEGDPNDIIPPSVADSCNDSNLTLQEKMLCELNQGMKNQNSESNPSDSLNNLLKDLTANNAKDNKAINTNVKGLKDNTAIANSRLSSINNKLTSLKTIGQQEVINGNKTNEELAKITTAEEGSTPDLTELNNSSSWIDNIANQYQTFYDNLQSQNATFKTFAVDAQTQIQEGFNLELQNNNIVTCPTVYEIDLSTLGQENIILDVDFCSQTSRLRPYLYPFLIIVLMLGLIFFTFKMVGTI
ncbi:hypothetical protein KO488_08320 [Poseidonibacter lekithochrous]|uniref:hypothetical protein n=1 Tax=Poseidonibacter TaxID=2321187 RepID=UPI001C099F6A|nr:MULTISPECIES: hypothetical protein [Poseidonibacter]MBU3014759.1 hypothetical protein [Poseidonibacter lekithochrous]MDO6828057.1 hypothetical protein [Poseidonibacter sp. 1_MG-2023]